MSKVTVNGMAVINGCVSLPVKGAWVADFEIDGTDLLPTGQRAVTIDLGSQTLVGTVATDRQGAYAGRLTVRVVGGGNGLAKQLPARKYRGVPVSIPLADIINETGERLAATATAATLNFALLHWARARAPASSSLEFLLAKAGASWRVLPDGTLWVGTDTFPESSFDGEVLEERHGGNWKLLASDTGTLLPATTFQGRRLAGVVYRIKQDSFRVEAWAA